MERLLGELLKRAAVFDVVVWEGMPRLSIHITRFFVTGCLP